jgi:two-component system chemotaxis response regulator CheB
MPQRCIVLGASAGGVEALKVLVSYLPADLPAPVFVVLHIPAYTRSLLAEILSKSGPLPAIHPEDGAKIRPSTIYIAPPDHHLLIHDGCMAVKKGPRENGFRPSIDALFRSAAYAYRQNAIGVVLSGALHDGTSGLWTIKHLGGIAIVQEPDEALHDSMPRSALESVEVDYRLPAREIGELLGQLVYDQPAEERIVENHEERDLEDRIAKEVEIAAGTKLSEESILNLGEPTSFTCPECHGALIRIEEGKQFRFRCHTGHGYTEDALLERAMQSTGEMIWQATRGLQEVEMLLKHIGQHIRDAGDPQQAESFFAKARELEGRASRFQKEALDHESLSTDTLIKQQPSN